MKSIKILKNKNTNTIKIKPKRNTQPEQKPFIVKVERNITIII